MVRTNLRCRGHHDGVELRESLHVQSKVGKRLPLNLVLPEAADPGIYWTASGETPPLLEGDGRHRDRSSRG